MGARRLEVLPNPRNLPNPSPPKNQANRGEDPKVVKGVKVKAARGKVDPPRVVQAAAADRDESSKNGNGPLLRLLAVVLFFVCFFLLIN